MHIAGRKVSGYGVASGQRAARYPRGTIELQRPHFEAKGVPMHNLHNGTINVDISPSLAPTHLPPTHDVILTWFEDTTEHFSLYRAVLLHDNERYTGFWYFPDPATKPGDFHKPSIVELLMPFVPGLHDGDSVSVLLL